jgi:hypothetical protein
LIRNRRCEGFVEAEGAARDEAAHPHAQETLMAHPTTLRSMRALVAIAAGFCGAAFAQSMPDTSATANATTTTTTTTTTVALPTVPSDATAAPSAQTTVTTQTTLDPNAAIGSTALTRSDSSNEAFEKLAHDRAFLAPSDVAQLPGFGDAFAKADRNGDGRLDRTEFSDAWSYYVDRGASGASTATVTTATPSNAPSQ